MQTECYRGLKVWQVGMQLAKSAYILTRDFPKHELYGLSSQVQRAAVSIAANIAEGRARDSTKDFLRHLSIAQGSVAELETLLILAEDLGYCTDTQSTGLLGRCAEEGRMLSGLQKRLRGRLTSD